VAGKEEVKLNCSKKQEKCPKKQQGVIAIASVSRVRGWRRIVSDKLTRREEV